ATSGSRSGGGAIRGESRRGPWFEAPARISLRGRRRRLRIVKPIAPGVRLPDFRETAKGPEGDASAIIVRSADRARRLKRNGSLWRTRRSSSVRRSGRNGCARSGRNHGRTFEQAGRIVLRPERRTGRQRGERDD